MYTDRNYKSKKALKADLAAGVQITVYQPGPFGSDAPRTGDVSLEGPHYPQPHKWYARVHVENGIITKVIS